MLLLVQGSKKLDCAILVGVFKLPSGRKGERRACVVQRAEGVPGIRLASSALACQHAQRRKGPSPRRRLWFAVCGVQ